MKLWKSKKPISCVPGKSVALRAEDRHDASNGTNTNAIPLAPLLSVDRAMSPAQSEDSGLAPERGTTYATITLPRDNAANMGITLAERNDLSYPPVVGTLSPVGHAADFLAPGDRIHQIDGISTIGLTNQHIMSMLCSDSSVGTSGSAIVEIEYSLPEYISQNSLCVTSKLAQITVEREGGCLGLTLRGGGDFPLIVTHVRPHGPVYKTGRIKPGDRLLRVDNVSLIGKTLAEAQQIIKCDGHISGYANLTIEYDVSVVQSVEFSMGPLLIEIERPMNDKLGLVLCNYVGTTGHAKIDEISAAGIYIASILPASIADRCGALSVGDQLLSIDDNIIENAAYTPDEVMTMLDTSTGRGYTQLQIMPAHALARRGQTTIGSPKYGFSTLESRKSRQRQRFIRKSSLPLEAANNGTLNNVNVNANANNINHTAGTNSNSNTNTNSASSSSNGSSNANTIASAATGSGSASGNGSGICLGIGNSNSVPSSLSSCSQASTNASNTSTLPLQSSTFGSMGLCRAETFPVLLDCSQGSGIVLGAVTGNGRAITIAQILPDSAAARCGCIQQGDRIIAINKMYNLDVSAMRQLLAPTALATTTATTNPPKANWVELELEFDMADAVVPSSGVFNIKLIKLGKAGLGISLNGSSHGGYVISDVKPGSPAHRTGPLRAGDILLAVDNISVQHFNVDSMLKEGSSGEFTMLTIKRIVLPDFLFDAQQRAHNTPIYSNCPPIMGGGVLGVVGLPDHDLYGNAKYGNDCISMKSTTPQPDFYGSREDSVQLRHYPVGNRTWGHIAATTTMGGRSLAMPNTLSLNTELPDDDNNYSERLCYDLERYASVDCTTLPPPMESRVYGSAASSSSKSSASGSGSGSSLQQIIFTVHLEPKGGLLGITLAGSEDISKPITISGIVEGGVAHKNGQIQVGDQLLAINDEPVQGMPLSHATSILQSPNEVVDLKVLRAHDASHCFGFGASNASNNNDNAPPPAQAIYAQVQRRPRSPSSAATEPEQKHRIFHITLYKDKVYDDYGFSVSDGLYERGVFINRIRSGGPADMCGMLRPFDRIMQVNEMKTQDFDCCLTVPLIAAAGDKIDLLIQRTE